MLTILNPNSESGLKERVLFFARTKNLVIVNLSMTLAETLAESSVSERAEIVRLYDFDNNSTYLLHNIEILFELQLQVDPLRWLEYRARSHRLYVIWPGGFDDQHLSYAEPGHPEHQRFNLGDFPAIKTQSI